ncbi:chitin synthase-domain-containing protein [Halteromyces radiatus]|uniref:chitin synthase-domain-containing protein n=1 Tax=Halteromyces radiatus TaxID=101107 RepID=UPI00221EAC07|nr:chitin synthase-domain-containing protein [Halteromyces radiatus]KAI8076904.1 chitin synthase-domain-containing protein [Halteromyces radiatus]
MGKHKESSSSSDLIDIKDIKLCLQTRHSLYQPYTNLGSNHLVAINPHKTLTSNDDQTSLDYVAIYKDIHHHSLDPHLYNLVNHTYYHMRRTGNDQTIFLSGESGSGKTTLRQFILRHLVRLGSHKKETKVQTQILQSQLVLNSFGQAASTYNQSHSLFGYYGEIQFNERGRLIGAKTLHYCFDKTRIILHQQPNFQVFYQLIAGADQQERQTLQLTTDPSHYRYLKGGRTTPNDADAFQQLKSSLKSSGFRKDHIHRIIQLLAAILHLGNLIFMDPSASSGQEAAFVKNTDELDLVADMLGLDPRALENVLTFKTTLIRKDITTLILNAEQANLQRDELVKILYSLLFSWLVHHINNRTCHDQFSSFIGLLDFPGVPPTTTTTGSAGFHTFCLQLANERIHQFYMSRVFNYDTDLYTSEGIQMEKVDYRNNASCLELLTRPSKSISTLLNNMTENAATGKRSFTDTNFLDSAIKYNGQHRAFSLKTSSTSARHFAVEHYSGSVTYNPDGFLQENSNLLSVDFVSLFRGNADTPASWNGFLVELFSDDHLATSSHPRHASAIATAQQSAKPTRQPSLRKSKRQKDDQQNDDEPSGKSSTTVLGQTQSALDDLFNSIEEANLWSVLCIQPNDQRSPTVFDSQRVQQQIETLALSQIAQRMKQYYIQSMSHSEFLDRYSIILESRIDINRLPRSCCDLAIQSFGWSHLEATVGNTMIFLAQVAWTSLENQLRQMEKEQQRQHRDINKSSNRNSTQMDSNLDMSSLPSSQLHSVAAAAGLPQPTTNSRYDDHQSFYSEDEIYTPDDTTSGGLGGAGGKYQEGSYYGSDSYGYSNEGDTKGLTLDQQQQQQQQHFGYSSHNTGDNYSDDDDDEKKVMSTQRKQWLFFVWAVTWWIPSKFLNWCGHMKRKDVQIAWREKVALCFIIFLMCGFVIWFLVFFGEWVCPHQNVFSVSELQSRSEKDNAYVSIRGEVFDLTSFAPRHYPSDIIPISSLLEYAGKDVTTLFPIQVSALCEGTTEPVSPYVSLDYQVNLTDKNAQYHDFRYSSEDYQPDWYYDQMTMLRQQYKKGNMGYEYKAVSDQANSATLVNGIQMTRNWAVLDNRVYDLSSYILGGRYTMAPKGQQPPANVNVNFMDDSVVNLFRTNSAKCQFSTYLLLIVTCLLASVILFKFLAALRIGSARAPEEHDKFVICQITCYTEDEESLRKTVDSIAKLTYDDKRKLMFIICDGMIVGSGNDRPTPRIVLDILNVDAQVDPEPLSFVSVGEGQKQHNMGKVYSGLYEVGGHVVPYLVVVKCGKPTERQKPGNRGKRDSQLILMQFLNRVHFDAPMNPMQLEIYHQMKNVIGVNPSFYEFVLMVDADTEVLPDGLNNLVSAAVHDSKIIGICGETTLSNEKDTWVTMIQVYEYFISHHMIKAFESLFSTVSCLPGCFTMYRVRTVDGKRPLFISNEVINDYSVNVVDTLHKKNLLHLGEDRYLTTLLLKHFANFKTKFTSDAQCKTNAPDLWSVLISQRRRWINSTIHNLGELMFLPRLCGFCCFSMRFVVILDLISTLVMPALVGYLIYLFYEIGTASDGKIPIISIATIAGVYGLQALLFIIKRKWEYIIWMLVSILAIPVFSFYIPIYSYWHFDDFSWGNTRVVMGEKGKKIKVADEGEFDPKTIPTMTWTQYEKTILAEDWNDGGSQISSAYTNHSRRGMQGPESVYGGSDTMSAHYTLNPSAIDPRTASGLFTMDGSMMMPSSGSMMMMPSSSGMMPSSSSAPMLPLQAGQNRFSLASGSMTHLQPSRLHSRQSLTLDGLDSTPSNEEILQQVQRILSTADLTQITKKQVREQLQQIFGVSMTNRKDYINACIENILQDRVKA